MWSLGKVPDRTRPGGVGEVSRYDRWTYKDVERLDQERSRDVTGAQDGPYEMGPEKGGVKKWRKSRDRFIVVDSLQRDWWTRFCFTGGTNKSKRNGTKSKETPSVSWILVYESSNSRQRGLTPSGVNRWHEWIFSLIVRRPRVIHQWLTY